MTEDFVHLRVYSAHSLLLSTVRIKEVVDRTKRFDMSAVALTDLSNMSGALEFAIAARDSRIQPVMGVTLNMTYETSTFSIVLLAKNEPGYRNIIKLSTAIHRSRDNVVSKQEIADSNNGLILLIGCCDGLVSSTSIFGQKQLIADLFHIFGDRLYLELQRYPSHPNQELEYFLLDIANSMRIPVVATNSVYFIDRDMNEAHDALICISDGKYVSQGERRKSIIDCSFKSAKEMQALFNDLPDVLRNTTLIAQRCAIAPSPRHPALPKLAGALDENEMIVRSSHEGLKHKILAPDSIYLKRLDFELDVIMRMGYSGYFLIVADFIKWSRDNGISVGPGRGSGAGSLVAWALGITNVDPIRFGLIFERFLNPERISMPDFDIDFCQEKRDQIIEYVRNKYGYDRVAQIVTFGKLQTRAVLRDVGRVLGMPYMAVDNICKMIPNNPAHPVTLAEAISLDANLKKEYENDDSMKRLMNISFQLEGLYRHASVHAAGVIISDSPLEEVMPLYYDGNLPMSQYSMKYVELAGFIKFDFLGLKTLTLIDKASRLIKEHRGIAVEINDLTFDDTKTFAMLGIGNVAGVFQLEGNTSRRVLQQLKPDCIEDIIALISLNRPGPMENIPTYIERKHGIKESDFMHPMLESALKETFGVIVYQEQVMDIARILAGYSLGGADLLRRAMGKKIPAEMANQEAIFIEGAVRNGVDKLVAKKIFALVDKFAGYGFNKSHATAYATISYQTAWLKANYEIEFFVSCLNMDIHDTDKLEMFVREVRKSNIDVLPPDINKSCEHFSIENGAIRYALLACKGLGAGAAREIVSCGRPFDSIFVFLQAINIKAVNKKSLESLIFAGAFDGIHTNRRQLFESVSLLLKFASGTMIAHELQASMFDSASEVCLPDVEDWGFDEKLAREFSALGFYLTGHPLSGAQYLYYGIDGLIAIANMHQHSYGMLLVTINKVSIKSTKRGRYAILGVSDPTGSCEVSLYSDVIGASQEECHEKNIIFISMRSKIGNDGEVRISARSIHSFGDYLVNRHLKLHLKINDKFRAGALHRVLNSTKSDVGSQSKVAVSVVLDYAVSGENISFRLPKLYRLDAISFANIGNIVGLEAIAVAGGLSVNNAHHAGAD